MTRVLSPSDVLLHEDEEVLVGGRVSYADEHRLVLSDALASVELRLSESCPVQPGYLVTCRTRGTDRERMLVELLSVCPAPEPRGDGEFARLSGSGRGRAIEARSRALGAVRQYFGEQGFVEVETPVFVPSPGLDPHVHSLAEVRRGARVDHLITSPEFHMKRLLSGGLPRIFQVARCFRAEEYGARHEPEFTLLEWYRAFSPLETMLADTEEIVARVFSRLSTDGSYPGGRMARPFARLTVREAFTRFSDVPDAIELATSDPDAFFETLVSRVEPGLASLGRPVFLTHYPASMAALARLSPDDPTVAERFELYVGQTELSNGYGELTDAVEQRARFEREVARRRAAGEPVYPLDERFLQALHEGMPPSVGNALGLDRLIALALGLGRISETLAFSDEER